MSNNKSGGSSTICKIRLSSGKLVGAAILHPNGGGARGLMSRVGAQMLYWGSRMRNHKGEWNVCVDEDW